VVVPVKLNFFLFLIRLLRINFHKLLQHWTLLRRKLVFVALSDGHAIN
jgi:hypothetical protein